MVLELCDGGTLETTIEKMGKIPEKYAKMVLYHIIRGLAGIHSQNIAHRDLKPENIFIKGKNFKLGDFGFASDKKQFETHLGTCPYMAPEILCENPKYNLKVDIWAAGCIFHQMLFGETPFPSDNVF